MELVEDCGSAAIREAAAAKRAAGLEQRERNRRQGSQGCRGVGMSACRINIFPNQKDA